MHVSMYADVLYLYKLGIFGSKKYLLSNIKIITDKCTRYSIDNKLNGYTMVHSNYTYWRRESPGG